MPCLAVHLAVAEKYLKKHPEENREEFLMGSIAPDVELPDMDKYIRVWGKGKKAYHFGNNDNTEDPREYMRRKVDFLDFFENNDIETSFRRGYFLHLLCDSIFFKEYVDYSKIDGLTAKQVKQKAYNEYNIITPILIEKYNLVIPDIIKSIVLSEGKGELELLNVESTYDFVDRLAVVDLQEEKNKILNR